MVHCSLIFEPGKYEAYLAFMINLIHFSMINSLLMFMQKTDAPYVCSFSKWKEMSKLQCFDNNHSILSEEECRIPTILTAIPTIMVLFLSKACNFTSHKLLSTFLQRQVSPLPCFLSLFALHVRPDMLQLHILHLE